LAITGDQFQAPGDIIATITTDSSSDPTIAASRSIDNDTTYAWTAFEEDVGMSNAFTLTDCAVTSPDGWSVTSVTAPMLDINPLDPDYGLYVGSIYMTGTPTIPIGGELDWQFTVQFSGSSSFALSETLTPTGVPEPASAGVLALGGIGLLARRHRKH
jgi:hypothetical protein